MVWVQLGGRAQMTDVSYLWACALYQGTLGTGPVTLRFLLLRVWVAALVLWIALTFPLVFFVICPI